jgi:ATP-dependent Lhr-like helicase
LAQEIGFLLMNDINPDFLDAAAKKILQSERNTCRNIGWSSDKWILESSSENAKIYLWTFSGHKINRTISALLSTMIEEESTYDYRSVTINTDKKNVLTVNKLNTLLSNFKSKSSQGLEAIIEDKIDVKWFSKFSDCLPDFLAKKTIREKGMDIQGLVRQITHITIT